MGDQFYNPNTNEHKCYWPSTFSEEDNKSADDSTKDAVVNGYITRRYSQSTDRVVNDNQQSHSTNIKKTTTMGTNTKKNNNYG